MLNKTCLELTILNTILKDRGKSLTCNKILNSLSSAIDPTPHPLDFFFEHLEDRPLLRKFQYYLPWTKQN